MSRRPLRRPGEHGWVDDVCRYCGLRRHVAWVRDVDGPVMALTWVTPDADVVRARPFPLMLGVAPGPEDPVGDAFPDELVGPEPPCPNDPALW